MASWERDHTTDPALKQLAFDIETTQLQQIGRMLGTTDSTAHRRYEAALRKLREKTRIVCPKSP